MEIIYKISVPLVDEKKFSDFFNTKSNSSSNIYAYFNLSEMEFFEKRIEENKSALNIKFNWSIETKYSKEDYDMANWFSFRSIFHSGYNLFTGNSDSKHQTFSNDICPKCGYNKRQINPFGSKIIKEIDKRYFVSLFLDDDYIFAFHKTKEKLEDLQISELSFLRVFDGSYNYLDNLYQMEYPIDTIDSFIPNESVKKTVVCPKCGHQKYVLNGKQLKFDSKAFNKNNYSIFKTHETFGDGIRQARITIIDKKMYLYFKDNKMLNGVEIHPIKLI